MIVYQATRARFLGYTDNRDIEDVIATRYLASTGRYAPHAEFNSWRDSRFRVKSSQHSGPCEATIPVHVKPLISLSRDRLFRLIVTDFGRSPAIAGIG